jgi:hypothetical protein
VSDTGAGRAQLLADAPAEQIGAPVKARVLLDHVHQQLAQPDRLTLGVAARATHASATAAGSATAPLKSASRSASV